jgi:alanine racemase
VTAAADALAARWAWAEVDLGAVAHNVEVVRARAAPAEIWVVVKADGYGHGAMPVARAALGAGASGLCVALAAEGVTLREAGIAAPILVLSQQPAPLAATMVRHGLTPTVYDVDGIDAVADAAHEASVTGFPVHLKIDTGMHRVGARVDDAGALVARIAARPTLRLAGVFTHLALADEPDRPATRAQLAAFDGALSRLALPTDVAVHAANSAGALAHAGARRSLVRVGIAAYGLPPGPGVAALCTDLRPALSLRARVSFVKRLHAGDRLSYGWRHELAADATIATIPIGYADGVPRRLYATGGTVLVGGKRRPIVGVVTMDQLMVDCGDDEVEVGAEAVLIGRQGDGVVTATEWADRLGTIDYEITCGISARVPRRYVGR